MFRTPTAGGEPERMGEFPLHTIMGQMKITPDGAAPSHWSTASDSNNPNDYHLETWLLENFEPKAPAAK